MTCSHAWYDREVREKNLMVGVMAVAPYYDPQAPSAELAGTQNTMYTGRDYVCINCGDKLAIPGPRRASRFIEASPGVRSVELVR